MPPSPAAAPTLAALLERPDIWRGGALAAATQHGTPTGFADLDAELPGGGWPGSAMTELLSARTGVGELALLLPVLAHVSGDERAWLVCVAPPYSLHAPALEAGGVALSRLLVANASGRDAAWACERALDTGSVGAVVAWLPEAGPAVLRRLQLAAEASRSLFFVFRPSTCSAQSSPAPLRLLLEGEGASLRVRLLKRRGGVQTTPLSLSIPRPVTRHALARPSSAAPAARSLPRLHPA